MVAFLAQRPAASLEITGQKPSVSANLMDQFAAYQRARTRASGRFPREGRKSRRRRPRQVIQFFRDAAQYLLDVRPGGYVCQSSRMVGLRKIIV